MSRKAITKIALEIGITSMQLSLLRDRIKLHVLADDENVTEWEGMGVFKNSAQQVRYIVRDSFVFEIPSRNVVAMSEPRRRRTTRTPILPTEKADMRLSYSGPNGSGFSYSIANGSIVSSPPIHPGSQQGHNPVFEKLSSNVFKFSFAAWHNPTFGGQPDDWFGIQYVYEATRFKSGWTFKPHSTNGSDPALIEPVTLTIDGGTIDHPFGPVNYFDLGDGSNYDLEPAYVGLATSMFAVHQGGIV